MMTKTTKIQANFARRREIEQQCIERNAAVGKYFDTWGKTTSRQVLIDSANGTKSIINTFFQI